MYAISGSSFQHVEQPLVAVEDISFTIARGEILGVVGESGAGKSLTGSALIGLLQPPGRIASGSIYLSNRRIDNLSQAEQRKLRGRHIGAIFQDPLTSLDPLFTVGCATDRDHPHPPADQRAAQRASARCNCCGRSESPILRAVLTSIRINSPVACGNGS